jgi:DNA topoisomerase-3
LGATKRQNGYLEGNGYLVSWCFGHLAFLADADYYDSRYSKWRKEDLPIIPSSFRFRIAEDKRNQFDILRMLMSREDVSTVINACDAGREGELIFRSVYYLAGCSKPMKRLWISSMEDEAIRDGFQSLRPGSDYDGLHQSALSRAKADWLVGINATRFFSLLYGTTLNIGRVMSPTLALLVQRESEISAFVPEPFYTVNLDCGFTASSERTKSKEEAQAIAHKCKGNTAKVLSADRKEKTENPPLLYDLTTLQRDANRLLGYTAQQTLDYLQSLYEKKLCTYPRTDSRYLSNDMAVTAADLVATAAVVCGKPVPQNVDADRVCNSKKVTDHHAIIPTTGASQIDLTSLPKGELEVLKLLSVGLLKALSMPHKYAETVIALECEGQQFTAKGKTVLEPGWKSYEPVKEEKTEKLPDLKVGQKIPLNGVAIKEGKTTPPKHYTEDTLLSSMETAGVQDMPEEAERKGLGTPATRAGILEKLISAGFAERRKAQKQTHLVPTANGMALITVLPEALQSPLLTAEWENKLTQIQKGELSPDAFLGGIVTMLQELIHGYKPILGTETLFLSGKEVVGSCPRCGNAVTEAKKGFFCENPGCSFALWKENRFFTAKKKELTKSIVSDLLRKGSAQLKGCYSPKTGSIYNATVILVDDGSKTDFKLDFGSR